MQRDHDKAMPGAHETHQPSSGATSAWLHQQGIQSPKASLMQMAGRRFFPTSTAPQQHVLHICAPMMTQASNGQQSPRPPSSPPSGRPRRQSPGVAFCTRCSDPHWPIQSSNCTALEKGLPCPGPNRLDLEHNAAEFGHSQSATSRDSCFSYHLSSHRLQSRASTAGTMPEHCNPSISRHSPSINLGRLASSQHLRPASPLFAYRRHASLIRSLAHEGPGRLDQNSSSCSSSEHEAAHLPHVSYSPASSFQSRPPEANVLPSTPESRFAAQPSSTLGIDASNISSCSCNMSDSIGWVPDSPVPEAQSDSPHSFAEWDTRPVPALSRPASSMYWLLGQLYEQPNIHDRPDTAWDP